MGTHTHDHPPAWGSRGTTTTTDDDARRMSETRARTIHQSRPRTVWVGVGVGRDLVDDWTIARFAQCVIPALVMSSTVTLSSCFTAKLNARAALKSRRAQAATRAAAKTTVHASAADASSRREALSLFAVRMMMCARIDEWMDG